MTTIGKLLQHSGNSNSELCDRSRAAYNIVLANIPPKIINFHYWLIKKIFLTFGFGESGGTSQVPLRYSQF